MKAIFFDLDGTLCDNALATRKCREASLDYFITRFPGHDPEEIAAVYASVVQQEERYLDDQNNQPFRYANGTELRLDRFRKILGTLDMSQDLAPTLVRIYGEAKIKHLREFPEVHSVLSQLQGQCVLGVITNGFTDLQNEELTYLELAHYFEHIIIAQDVGFWKPDERIFLHALKAAGVAAEDTLMVGDNPKNDIASPAKLGIKTGLLLRSGQPDFRAYPAILLSDLTPLPALVSQTLQTFLSQKRPRVGQRTADEARPRAREALACSSSAKSRTGINDRRLHDRDDRVRFVYFDVGGVILIDFSGNDKWEQLKRELRVPKKQDEAFSRFWDRYEPAVNRGRDVSTLIPLMKRRFHVRIPRKYSLLLNGFVDRFEANKSIWPVLERIRKTCGMGLLTNMYPHMLEAIMSRAPWPKTRFDVTIDSSLIGLAKPDAQIFRLAEQQSRCRRDTLLLVDNSAINIRAASERGWHVFQYDPVHPRQSSAELLQLVASQSCHNP